MEFRKVTFYERLTEVIDTDKSLSCGTHRLDFNITRCSTVSPHAMWLGDSEGFIFKVDRSNHYICFKSFDTTCHSLIYLPQIDNLIAIGLDTSELGGWKYKVYNCTRLDQQGFPVCIKEARILPSEYSHVQITTVAANADFTQLAVGTDSEGIFLFRGALSRDKTCRRRIIRDLDAKITFLSFTRAPNSSDEVEVNILFAATAHSVASILSPFQGDPSLIYVDVAHGVSTPTVAHTVEDAGSMLLAAYYSKKKSKQSDTVSKRNTDLYDTNEIDENDDDSEQEDLNVLHECQNLTKISSDFSIRTNNDQACNFSSPVISTSNLTRLEVFKGTVPALLVACQPTEGDIDSGETTIATFHPHLGPVYAFKVPVSNIRQICSEQNALIMVSTSSARHNNCGNATNLIASLFTPLNSDTNDQKASSLSLRTDTSWNLTACLPSEHLMLITCIASIPPLSNIISTPEKIILFPNGEFLPPLSSNESSLSHLSFLSFRLRPAPTLLALLISRRLFPTALALASALNLPSSVRAELRLAFADHLLGLKLNSLATRLYALALPATLASVVVRKLLKLDRPYDLIDFILRFELKRKKRILKQRRLDESMTENQNILKSQSELRAEEHARNTHYALREVLLRTLVSIRDSSLLKVTVSVLLEEERREVGLRAVTLAQAKGDYELSFELAKSVDLHEIAVRILMDELKLPGEAAEYLKNLLKKDAIMIKNNLFSIPTGDKMKTTKNVNKNVKNLNFWTNERMFELVSTTSSFEVWFSCAARLSCLNESLSVVDTGVSMLTDNFLFHFIKHNQNSTSSTPNNMITYEEVIITVRSLVDHIASVSLLATPALMLGFFLSLRQKILTDIPAPTSHQTWTDILSPSAAVHFARLIFSSCPSNTISSTCQPKTPNPATLIPGIVVSSSMQSSPNGSAIALSIPGTSSDFPVDFLLSLAFEALTVCSPKTSSSLQTGLMLVSQFGNMRSMEALASRADCMMLPFVALGAAVASGKAPKHVLMQFANAYHMREPLLPVLAMDSDDTNQDGTSDAEKLNRLSNSEHSDGVPSAVTSFDSPESFNKWLRSNLFLSSNIQQVITPLQQSLQAIHNSISTAVHHLHEDSLATTRLLAEKDIASRDPILMVSRVCSKCKCPLIGPPSVLASNPEELHGAGNQSGGGGVHHSFYSLRTTIHFLCGHACHASCCVDIPLDSSSVSASPSLMISDDRKGIKMMLSNDHSTSSSSFFQTNHSKEANKFRNNINQSNSPNNLFSHSSAIHSTKSLSPVPLTIEPGCPICWPVTAETLKLFKEKQEATKDIEKSLKRLTGNGRSGGHLHAALNLLGGGSFENIEVEKTLQTEPNFDYEGSEWRFC